MNNQPLSFDYPFTIRSASVLGDSIVFGTYRNSDVNEPDNCIRRLDRNFKELWKFPVRYSPFETAICANYVLAVTWDIFSGGGVLYCLEWRSGRCLWQKRIKDLATGSELLVTDDNVICFCDVGVVVYSMKNGKRLRALKHDNANNYYSSKMQNRSLICRSRASVSKLKMDDLSVEWTIEGFDDPMGFGSDIQRVFVAKDQKLNIYDSETGKQIGQINADPVSYILSDGQRLYFQSEHNNEERYVISCYSMTDRKAVWHTEVPIELGNARYSPQVEVLTDKVVIVRGHCGPVYSLDRATGRLAFLLAESNMPGNRFPNTNQPVLFGFLGGIYIQQDRKIYKLSDLPSDFLGTKVLDADKMAWASYVPQSSKD